MSQGMRDVAAVITRMVQRTAASQIAAEKAIEAALDAHLESVHGELPALQEALMALANKDAIRVETCVSCDGLRQSYVAEQAKRYATERERDSLTDKLHANTIALADERRLIAAMKVEARNRRTEIARLNSELKEARRAAKASTKETNK